MQASGRFRKSQAGGAERTRVHGVGSHLQAAGKRTARKGQVQVIILKPRPNPILLKHGPDAFTYYASKF